ncbi:hypothetical protein DUI87_00559 [Hirundo rustica rustica]|uniref:EF-hand domain-containing protein n=1 Tax=Hirundo rustica rustica TaxID=333673 RepID=A0A3M0LA23_HIRRU|nr:hypothetical protein DUI87_00559 [Hirundo rustica rustica]
MMLCAGGSSKPQPPRGRSEPRRGPGPGVPPQAVDAEPAGLLPWLYAATRTCRCGRTRNPECIGKCILAANRRQPRLLRLLLRRGVHDGGSRRSGGEQRRQQQHRHLQHGRRGEDEAPLLYRAMKHLWLYQQRDREGILGVHSLGFLEHLGNDLLMVCCQLNMEASVAEIMHQLGADENEKISFQDFSQRCMDLIQEIKKEEVELSVKSDDSCKQKKLRDIIASWPTSSNNSLACPGSQKGCVQAHISIICQSKKVVVLICPVLLLLPHPEYCMHFWVLSQYVEGIKLWECVQRREIKMLKDLKEKLRSLGLFSLEKRRLRGDPRGADFPSLVPYQEPEKAESMIQELRDLQSPDLHSNFTLQKVLEYGGSNVTQQAALKSLLAQASNFSNSVGGSCLEFANYEYNNIFIGFLLSTGVTGQIFVFLILNIKNMFLFIAISLGINIYG